MDFKKSLIPIRLRGQKTLIQAVLFPMLVLFFLLIITPVSPLYSPDTAWCLHRTEALNSKELKGNPDILGGIHLLYNRKFDEAEVMFRKVIDSSPDRPAGYFYLAMVMWSRMASGFWFPETVEEYDKRIDRAIEVARERIRYDTPDGYDFFYLGGALGFKGRFELMKSNWISSFFLATEAVDALKKCLEMEPQNRDVLLGLGIFDYYTARMSGILKFLSYLLVHRGDKEEGLRKLNLAAKEAAYSGTESKSMLLHIYIFLEEDFWKAVRLAEELSVTYQLNPRFRLLKGVCYVRLGMDPQFRDSIQELRQESLNASSPETADLWLRRAFYLESIYDLFHARYNEAREKIMLILDRSNPKTDPMMIAWPLVKMGMSYDLQGDRKEAVEYYQRVLKMENGSGAQFLAKRLLKSPPKAKDPFIGY
jgi:tetratricopeptide (TPR) repeat protein